jgi:hypothetical protein
MLIMQFVKRAWPGRARRRPPWRKLAEEWRTALSRPAYPRRTLDQQTCLKAGDRE